MDNVASKKIGFKRGQKVNYFDDMTKTMKVGFVHKKIKNQYKIGETMNRNEFYLDTAFDTTRGLMSLSK